jgi:poly(hydroxyalkanoate) depolymerase family esterase
MKLRFPSELLEATRLTKAGHLTQATAAIQRWLGTPRIRATAAPMRVPVSEAAQPFARMKTGAIRPFSGERLRDFRGNLPGEARPEHFRPLDGGRGQTVSPSAAGAGQFLAREFRNEAGSRPYRLYLPTGYHGQAVPLIVMLHGCTQTPEDFAAGTGMNAAAEERTCIVAYPGQIRSANARKCWNWFNPDDQSRDKGEPSLIAGITRRVMWDYAIDPERVYVAGLSAGGAAAAVMADAYPELYAAIGVHSGLASGAASDVHTALAAMRTGHGGFRPRDASAVGPKTPCAEVATIVFHGDRDTTVNIRNADAVVAQAAGNAALAARTEVGRIAAGHAWSRTVLEDANGLALVEQWVIHGSGHAWSGGSSAGSFVDPLGPDASREMLRFFLEHPRRARP